jgi:hypothetical protein
LITLQRRIETYVMQTEGAPIDGAPFAVRKRARVLARTRIVAPVGAQE